MTHIEKPGAQGARVVVYGVRELLKNAETPEAREALVQALAAGGALNYLPTEEQAEFIILLRDICRNDVWFKSEVANGAAEWAHVWDRDNAASRLIH